MTGPSRHLLPDTQINQPTSTGRLAAADFSPGTVVAGRFRVDRLLGMGGMGLVYQAHDTELAIDVALKLLRPELANRRDAFERFRQELLLARQVSSPHVVRIHDLVKHGNAWLISMDYVPGQSLERLLDQKGALAVDTALAITRQLALGLAAAHGSGVVHRDLKPANVLVNEQGDACITDFGVARSAGDTGITDSGVIIGTPAYLSPEQARAEPLDGRSDLYALGLILFEMLTGTLPFRGGTPAEMMVQRIVRDPPSADTVKPELPSFAVRLCAHLLELKPAHRFQSAEEVVRAIDTRRVPGLGRQRRRSLWLLLATAVVLGLAAAWLNWTPPPPELEGTALVQPASLDLGPMPLVLVDVHDGDAALAAGIDQVLAQSLAGSTALHSADATQMRNTLAELGFDAEAAARQRDRVFEVTGARRLLTGELRRSESGIALTLSLWERGQPASGWTATTAKVADTELAGELHQLLQKLQTALALPAIDLKWPDAAALRAIGRYQQVAPATTELDQVLTLALSAKSGALWWQLQASLDRAGRTADASNVARRALDALTADSDLAARRARAYARVLLGEYESVLPELQSLAASAPNDAGLRLLLARVQAETGEFAAALTLLNTLVSEDQRNLDAWYALGKYAIQSGDAKRAVDEYLVRAQVLANRIGDTRMQADVGNALGIGYRRLGQMDAAAERFDYAIRLRASLGDDRGQAASLRNLATVRSIQGDFAAAERALTQARTIIEPLGDAVALAALANDVGVLAEERGDYSKALASYREALRLRLSQGDARLIGESQVNVGFVYYQLGEFDNAQTYWQQATTTYATVDDQIGIVHARQSLGLAEIARGDWVQARASLDSSRAQAEAMQMAEERSISEAGLAELERLEGQMDRALANADAALRAFEQREDLRGIVEMHLLRSAVYLDLGDVNAADAELAALKPDLLQNDEQASLYAQRVSEVALLRAQYQTALSSADEAVAKSRKAGSHGVQLSAQLLRARALAGLNRTREARRELDLVRSGLTDYSSVPLQLLLAEAELPLDPDASGSRHRQTLALLARLPSYGRAFRIHAWVAASPQRTSAQASQAWADAKLAYTSLQASTPAPQHAPLAALAQALGLPKDAP